MNLKSFISMSGVLALVACGAGGGGYQTETGLTLLATTPSEDVLCSLVIGETTSDEVLEVLGEPTHRSEDAMHALFQYWIGDEADLGELGRRVILLSFDGSGTLVSPLVEEVPFPQCWREQKEAYEQAQRAPLDL